MRSGRTSSKWLITMLTRYPFQTVAIVAVLSLLTVTLHDRHVNDASPLPNHLAHHGETITDIATVTDGDSLILNGEKIRLWGIDAPELNQTCAKAGTTWACGEEAKTALTSLVTDKPVTCQTEDIDRYNRIVAECFIGNQSINARLVKNGWAIAYRRYSMAFVDEEKTAQQKEVGIWSGTFTQPWEWRQQQ